MGTSDTPNALRSIPNMATGAGALSHDQVSDPVRLARVLGHVCKTALGSHYPWP